jgi:hypothetical protein
MPTHPTTETESKNARGEQVQSDMPIMGEYD